MVTKDDLSLTRENVTQLAEICIDVAEKAAYKNTKIVNCLPRDQGSIIAALAAVILAEALQSMTLRKGLISND